MRSLLGGGPEAHEPLCFIARNEVVPGRGDSGAGQVGASPRPIRAGGPDSDIVEARYVEIVPNDRVVQAVDFVSDDRAFAGTMRMTWAVRAVHDGTLVEFIADDVPEGISAEDHTAGMASSAGKKLSMASSAMVTSSGEPKTVIVEK